MHFLDRAPCTYIAIAFPRSIASYEKIFSRLQGRILTLLARKVLFFFFTLAQNYLPIATEGKCIGMNIFQRRDLDFARLINLFG